MQVLFFLGLLALVHLVHSSTPAGIYVDNGFDQTTIERAMTKAEKREMEAEILHLLGLPNRPRRGVNAPLKKSAPRFLLDVYKSLMESENSEHSRSERSADVNFTGDEQNAIDESDIIMTFEAISESVSFFHHFCTFSQQARRIHFSRLFVDHHVSGVRHERGKRLWFDVAEVPVGEEIVGAELRIFQNTNFTKGKPESRYTVTAFQLIRADNG